MPLEITVSPTSGRIGDTVEITATSGNFNEVFNKNVVTFNGLDIDIIARIIRGNSTYDSLLVIVPPDAITGDITVETNTIPEETATISFEVVYDDESFPQEEVPYKKAVMNDKVRIVGTSDFNFPVYNKDISYSNFVEVYDENSLLQNVYSIVLTQKGERMFSTFGLELDKKLFNTTNDEESFKRELMQEIIQGVNIYEPRVTVLEESSFVIIKDGDANVLLSLLMPTGNVRELGITLKSANNLE